MLGHVRQLLSPAAQEFRLSREKDRAGYASRAAYLSNKNNNNIIIIKSTSGVTVLVDQIIVEYLSSQSNLQSFSVQSNNLTPLVTPTAPMAFKLLKR